MSKKNITTEIFLRELNGDFSLLKSVCCQRLHDLYIKEWYFECNSSLFQLYCKLRESVNQSSETAFVILEIIDNQQFNDICSIVFVANRLVRFFENRNYDNIRELVDRIIDDNIDN